MMLFSVYDKVAKCFGAPFVEASPEVAIRSFGVAQRTDQSMLGLCPDDFALYKVADFDEVTGAMVADPLSAPVKIQDGRSRGDNHE